MIRNKNEYLTTTEAARLLGFTPDHIRRLISQGIIKANEKLGNSWLISHKAIANVKRRRALSKPKE